MKSKITDRISPPTAEQVRAARKHAGLDQTQAAEMISPAGKVPRRTWANYEFDECKSKRTIPLGIWELFLLLTGQHPTLKVVEREADDQGDKHK